MAPNTSIRGGGANAQTNTRMPLAAALAVGPVGQRPVWPAASSPRASSVTASSARALPSVP